MKLSLLTTSIGLRSLFNLRPKFENLSAKAINGTLKPRHLVAVNYLLKTNALNADEKKSIDQDILGLVINGNYGDRIQRAALQIRQIHFSPTISQEESVHSNLSPRESQNRSNDTEGKRSIFRQLPPGSPFLKAISVEIADHSLRPGELIELSKKTYSLLGTSYFLETYGNGKENSEVAMAMLKNIIHNTELKTKHKRIYILPLSYQFLHKLRDHEMVEAILEKNKDRKNFGLIDDLSLGELVQLLDLLNKAFAKHKVRFRLASEALVDIVIYADEFVQQRKRFKDFSIITGPICAASGQDKLLGVTNYLYKGYNTDNPTQKIEEITSGNIHSYKNPDLNSNPWFTIRSFSNPIERNCVSSEEKRDNLGFFLEVVIDQP